MIDVTALSTSPPAGLTGAIAVTSVNAYVTPVAEEMLLRSDSTHAPWPAVPSGVGIEPWPIRIAPCSSVIGRLVQLAPLTGPAAVSESA